MNDQDQIPDATTPTSNDFLSSEGMEPNLDRISPTQNSGALSPKRRPRYHGTHPRKFHEKYKELSPERYVEELEKVKGRGQTPAGTHIPICMTEILEILKPQPGEIGLDATLGYGGHSTELLKAIQPKGKLFCTDVDPYELPRTEARLRGLGFPPETLSIHKSNYAGVLKILPLTSGGFDFVLADLGLSSMQIDNPDRGFTFKVPGPLDLRLNPERGQSAAAWIAAQKDEEKLIQTLLRHSDEFYAKAIAKVIMERKSTLTTTTALAQAVRDALEELYLEENVVERSIKRTFQAVRIAVNDEFSALDTFLRALPQILKPKGRVAILSFHSGEDQRVKRAFQLGLESGTFSSISEESIRPSGRERFENPRSKSAHLRWAIKA
jgi:16S rRNA (cytosine1402-N4)-methyltransferase